MFFVPDNYPINICCFPTDWCQEAVSKAEILRLIYQGRFLHSNVTLGALGLPFGKTTVMHLVPRETLPEPNSQGKQLYNYIPVIFLGGLLRRRVDLGYFYKKGIHPYLFFI